jgi:hypothetical protein
MTRQEKASGLTSKLRCGYADVPDFFSRCAFLCSQLCSQLSVRKTEGWTQWVRDLPALVVRLSNPKRA